MQKDAMEVGMMVVDGTGNGVVLGRVARGDGSSRDKKENGIKCCHIKLPPSSPNLTPPPPLPLPILSAA